MSDFAEYFLSSASSTVQLETLEISHPDFTQTYRLVRNAREGISATLETGPTVFFQYYPMRISPVKSSDDLDQIMRIGLGDLGEVIPAEIDAISEALGFGTKPEVRYRVYRSDDLTAPMHGPLLLEVGSFDFNREGSSFEAKAPSLNINRTGELYRLERFPMLRGFL